MSGTGNFLNVILDPILIFLCGLGVGGAAIATVISEYVSDVVNLVLCVHFARPLMRSSAFNRICLFVHQIFNSFHSSMEIEW